MTDRITIRTVADFFAVPADKRAHCLKDFLLWLTLTGEARALFAGTAGIVIPTHEFIWIDDGQHDAHLHVTVKAGEAGE